MAFPQGLNFRSSLGFVTDGANEAFTIGNNSGSATYPTTTPQGTTLGSEVSIIQQNRSSTVDRRLAGTLEAGAAGQTFRIDLPAAGAYNIRFAAGDASYGNQTAWDLYDTSTTLGNLTTGSITAGNYKDAQNVTYSAASWPGSNSPRSFTFTTTILRIRSAQASGNNSMAHFYIESALSGGSVATAAGTSTAAATGASTAAGTASAAGTGTVSGTGAASAAATATSAGTSTAAATNAASTSAVGGSAGSSTANATGAASASSTGAASGTSAASAVGSSNSAIVGTSSGTSTAAATSATSGNVGTASGTSTASGVSASLVSAIGAATGTSAASSASAYLLSAVGSATGTSTAQAASPTTTSAIGTAGGTSTAIGASPQNLPREFYFTIMRSAPTYLQGGTLASKQNLTTMMRSDATLLVASMRNMATYSTGTFL